MSALASQPRQAVGFKRIIGYRRHPVVDLFPRLEGPALEALVEDIRKNGLLEPIAVIGKEGDSVIIVDGWNRLTACMVAGVTPRFKSLPEGTDPVAYAIARNLHRRHLDASQRAMIAAKATEMFEGAARARQAAGTSAQICAKASEQAAEMLAVSPRSVESAVKVRREGDPELVAAVEKGEVKVSAAAAVAALPKGEQRQVVAQGPEAVRRKAKEARVQLPAIDSFLGRIRRLHGELDELKRARGRLVPEQRRKVFEALMGLSKHARGTAKWLSWR